MKLKSSNLFVRWAYLGTYAPERTDLCSMFWLIFFKTLGIAFVTTLAIFVGIEIWFDLMEVLRGVLMVVSVAIGLVGAAIFMGSAEDGVVREVIQGIKRGYCPIVEIEE